MWPGNDEWFVREHQQALLEEVQQRQLVSLVLSRQSTSRRYYGQALFWIGQWLTGWGTRLQERHAPPGCYCAICNV